VMLALRLVMTLERTVGLCAVTSLGTRPGGP
jgi:hypothetical protein